MSEQITKATLELMSAFMTAISSREYRLAFELTKQGLN